MTPQAGSYMVKVVPSACKEMKSDCGIAGICYFLIFS